jgi:hypothetical protein
MQDFIDPLTRPCRCINKDKCILSDECHTQNTNVGKLLACYIKAKDNTAPTPENIIKRGRGRPPKVSKSLNLL